MRIAIIIFAERELHGALTLRIRSTWKNSSRLSNNEQLMLSFINFYKIMRRRIEEIDRDCNFHASTNAQKVLLLFVRREILYLRKICKY